jgi:hypothetical protein
VHDAPRPGKHPRRDPVPAVETEINLTQRRKDAETQRDFPGLFSLATLRLCVKKVPTFAVPLAKLSPAGKTVEGFVQAVLYFPA